MSQCEFIRSDGRWWNPPVEWRAEDRAYRMNSERPVTVHKITTIDSIEEHMARIIAKRENLVRDIIDPQVAIEKLSRARNCWRSSEQESAGRRSIRRDCRLNSKCDAWFDPASLCAGLKWEMHDRCDSSGAGQLPLEHL